MLPDVPAALGSAPSRQLVALARCPPPCISYAPQRAAHFGIASGRWESSTSARDSIRGREGTILCTLAKCSESTRGSPWTSAESSGGIGRAQRIRGTDRTRVCLGPLRPDMGIRSFLLRVPIPFPHPSLYTKGSCGASPSRDPIPESKQRQWIARNHGTNQTRGEPEREADVSYGYVV